MKFLIFNMFDSTRGEPKSNFQYNFSSSVNKWQNAFQLGVDIFWIFVWKIRWDDLKKILDIIVQ
jgi:hypothetical protein